MFYYSFILSLNHAKAFPFVGNLKTLVSVEPFLTLEIYKSGLLPLGISLARSWLLLHFRGCGK